MKPKKTKNESPFKKRTVLTYIAGDNNLSNAGLEDISEMCEVGAGENTHVGVEIDTYGEFTGSIRYEISEKDWSGFAHRIVLERLSEKDSGDPVTLHNFLKWGYSRFKSDEYIVIIWNHGAGFRSPKRDIGYDDFGSSLNMPEITWALSKVGINKNNKISILGFDACLMNMLEIVHHFKDHVEIVVGSQQTEPGDGWPYDKVLKKVNSSVTLDELAAEIVNVYIDDYKRIGIQNITQSAVKTSESELAIKMLSDLGKKMSSKVENLKPILLEIRFSIQDFHMADYIDVIHLAELIIQKVDDNEIRSIAKNLKSAVSKCIIKNDSYGPTVSEANGLSIWFPGYQSIYINNRAKYKALKFSQKHTGWIEFLDSFFSLRN